MWLKLIFTYSKFTQTEVQKGKKTNDVTIMGTLLVDPECYQKKEVVKCGSTNLR